MHKKFEINRTKIKGGCQSRRKVVNHNSKSDLPLGIFKDSVIVRDLVVYCSIEASFIGF